MQLTDDQKQQVAGWVGTGAGLAEIQKKLSEDFGLTLTYMDVRFLVLDLGLAVKDKVVKAKPVAAAVIAPAHGGATAEDDFADAGADVGGDLAPGLASDAAPDLAPGAAGGVRVELDRLMKPGSVVSGTVTFGDGVTAAWSLDQLGRLALNPPKPGYSPTPEDVQAFQAELRRALERRGF